MNDSGGEVNKFFLAHPEVKDLFASVFSTIVQESYRGAVLIGAAHIDLHLRRLFETVAPKSISKRKLRPILEYPGSLSSLSAKTDIAYLTRLISDNVYEAINNLRRIRNDVAHSPDSFSLAEHEERLRKMYEVGHGVPAAINQWAGEVIIHSAVKNILEIKDPVSDEAEPAFATPQEALDYLSERPEIMAVLEERRPRYELALGIGIICGLIVYHRDRAKDVLGDNTVIGTLARKGATPQEASGS